MKEFIPQNSSSVKKIEYDENTKVMMITYINSKGILSTYEYDNVDPFTFDDLKYVKSVGEYVAKNIKNKFKYIKIK